MSTQPRPGDELSAPPGRHSTAAGQVDERHRPQRVGRRRASSEIPRLSYSPDEAAEALGVSRDYLDEHVVPELRVVRKGRRRLIPLRELERWLADNAHRAGEI